MKPSSFPSLAALVFALGGLAACKIDPKHPSTVDEDSGGGGSESGGRAGANSAGTSTDAGDDAGGDAGASSGGAFNAAGSGGGAPLPGSTQCHSPATWATPTKLDALSNASPETVLLSLTADELDVLVSRGAQLFTAHRAQASATFGPPQEIAVPMGWTAAHGAALSPDGKRLILISDPDQKQLGEVTRASRDAAFSSTVDLDAFDDVNTAAVYTGRIYASPVVSPGDTQLFVNSYFAEGASTVVVSLRETDTLWAPPVALAGELLDGTYTTRRLPSGVSADERTLFYFNEESKQAEARFRDRNTPSSPLYDTVLLGARRGAVPNGACDRLYSSTNGDVVVEAD